MIAADFMDTNVLVYAYDDHDPVKSIAAQKLLNRARIPFDRDIVHKALDARAMSASASTMA